MIKGVYSGNLSVLSSVGGAEVKEGQGIRCYF